LRRWAWVHRWSSIVSTLFLLVLCISGLPLLFGDELHGWLDPPVAYAKAAPGSSRASLDTLVRATRLRRPGEIIVTVFVDPAEPQVKVFTAVSPAAADAGELHWLRFDAYSARLLGDSEARGIASTAFDRFIYALHAQLLLGGAGVVLVGIIGILFVVALVSGAVLYAPFMRNLPFGTVRRDRSARTRRLDTHNLFGIVTLAWTVVVGFTGGLNELAGPLFAHWQQAVVAPAVTRWHGAAGPEPGAKLDTVLTAARHAVPNELVTGIDFPGATLGSPRHFMVWAHGNTPLTSRLVTPILVDAATARVVAVLPMPWYLRTIEVSRPFHFGDYGGLPLKLLWVVFDLATIVVLVTGIQLLVRPATVSR
jgi:uncharacterized iron-regulated membrane protein